MIEILIGLLILGGLFFSAFYSGAETGLYCANRVRLQVQSRQGDARAVRLMAFLGDEPSALTVTLLGVNLADYITTYAVAYFLSSRLGLSDHEVEAYTVGMLAPLVFVFATVVPKNLFQLHPDRLMMQGSRLLTWSSQLFRWTGAVWGLRSLAAWVNRRTLDPALEVSPIDSKWKMAFLLQESLAGKPHGTEQRELIDRVLQLSEMSLQSVMISAGRVAVIAATATRDELIRFARNSTYSRVPVYAGHKRRIIGIAHVDRLLGSEDWRCVGDRIESVLNLGPYDTVASAIAAMQAKDRKMAVVAEPEGPMLGIVTLRTLLELVVGGLALMD